MHWIHSGVESQWVINDEMVNKDLKKIFQKYISAIILWKKKEKRNIAKLCIATE